VQRCEHARERCVVTSSRPWRKHTDCGARSSRVMRCACIEFVDRWDNPQLDRYGRAGAQQGTRLAISSASVSWRRSTRSLLEARSSSHTFTGESSPGARGSPRRLPIARCARCVPGAWSTTDLLRCWLMCPSTTADSRTGSVRPASPCCGPTRGPSVVRLTRHRPGADAVRPGRVVPMNDASVTIPAQGAAPCCAGSSNRAFRKL